MPYEFTYQGKRYVAQTNGRQPCIFRLPNGEAVLHGVAGETPYVGLTLHLPCFDVREVEA